MKFLELFALDLIFYHIVPIVFAVPSLKGTCNLLHFGTCTLSHMPSALYHYTTFIPMPNPDYFYCTVAETSFRAQNQLKFLVLPPSWVQLEVHSIRVGLEVSCDRAEKQWRSLLIIVVSNHLTYSLIKTVPRQMLCCPNIGRTLSSLVPKALT